MNNTFNVCTACGTANPLSAKYCFQCGAQLKMPEEPVACPRCKTVNNGLAVFCRKCGMELKHVEQTKTCPKCNREVAIDSNGCQCGYTFGKTTTVVTTQTTKSAQKAKTAVEKKKQKATNKGGRIFALIALLLLSGFAMLTAYPTVLSFMKNITVAENYNFYSILLMAISACMKMNFAKWSIGEWMLYIMVVLLVLTMAIHVITAFIRLFSGRRPRRANGFYLLMTILTGMAVGIFFLATVPAVVNLVPFIHYLRLAYTPVGGAFTAPAPGYLLIAIPAFYLVMFIGSLIARRGKAKLA